MLVVLMFCIRFIAWRVYGKHLTQIVILSGERSCTCIIASTIFGSGLCVLVISPLYRRGGTRRRIAVTLTRIRCIHVGILMPWRIGLKRGRQRRSMSKALQISVDNFCSTQDFCTTNAVSAMKLVIQTSALCPLLSPATPLNQPRVFLTLFLSSTIYALFSAH